MTPEEILGLMETDPWWIEISEELDRAWRIHHVKRLVSDTHKIEAVNALQEHTFITEEKLRLVSSDPVFIEARAILADLAPGDSFPERLFALYKSKKPDAFIKLKQFETGLMGLVSDREVKERIERIGHSHRTVLKQIYQDNAPLPFSIGSANDRYVVCCLSELACVGDGKPEKGTVPVFPGLKELQRHGRNGQGALIFLMMVEDVAPRSYTALRR